MRVKRSTFACTKNQSIENPLDPFSTMTVGEPFPVQCKCSLRPPRSMSRPKGEGATSHLGLLALLGDCATPNCNANERSHTTIKCRVKELCIRNLSVVVPRGPRSPDGRLEVSAA